MVPCEQLFPLLLLLFVSSPFVVLGESQQQYSSSFLNNDAYKWEELLLDDKEGEMMSPAYRTYSIGGNRILQTTPTDCINVGATFQCTIFTTISDSYGSDSSNKTGAYTNLTIYTKCALDSQIGFDFRKASNCDCEVNVARMLANGTIPPPKFCPCVICSEGFGNNPVSVDCSAWDTIDNNSTNATSTGNATNTGNATSIKDGNATDTGNSTNATQKIDGYIVNTCTSLDCGLACNGTCNINCANSASSCPFCSNNPNNTIPPTGGSGGSSGGGSAPTPSQLSNFGGSAASDRHLDYATIIIMMIVPLTLYYSL